MIISKRYKTGIDSLLSGSKVRSAAAGNVGIQSRFFEGFVARQFLTNAAIATPVKKTTVFATA